MVNPLGLLDDFMLMHSQLHKNSTKNWTHPFQRYN